MNIPTTARTPAYAEENGTILIDVHISSMDQFYNLLDPLSEEENESPGRSCGAGGTDRNAG